MPRLSVCGQRLNVGADDLFMPASVGLANKAVFTGVSALFLVIALGLVLERCDEEPSAPERMLVWLYAGTTALSALGFAVYSAMLYTATRGTPLEAEKRTAMPTILKAAAALYVAELGFAAALIYVAVAWPQDAHEEGSACDVVAYQQFALLVFAIVCILVDALTFFLAVPLFLHRYDADKMQRLHLEDFDRRTVEWDNCLRVWCRIFRVLSCNMFGFVGNGEEADEAYQSVAEVFNSWFSDTGLTVTDLLTGFILVRMDQKNERRAMQRYTLRQDEASEFYASKKSVKKLHNVLSSSVRALQVAPAQDLEEGSPAAPAPAAGVPVPEHDPKELWRLFNLHHEYLPYMLGMYGWKLMLYRHTVRLQPFTGLRKVLRMPGKKVDVGHGDNWCHCTKSALLRETGLEPDQVVYGSFGSQAKDSAKSIQVSHAVFVDHERRSVVVAMRGTLSLQDLMTDAMIDPQSLVETGRTWGFDGAGHYAHKGMLLVALRIRRILEKNLVLHRLLGAEVKRFEYIDNTDTDGLEALNMHPAELPNCRGYDLVITGHSLGGAAAMLLTLCLRPSFPEARCVAYALPGCIVDYELAEKSKEWCTSVFLGHDLVPNLSWDSLIDLKRRIFDVLYRCKVSKATVLRSALLGKSSADLLYEPFEVPESEGRAAMKRRIEALRTKRASKRIEQIKLFSPGVIIHLTKVETVTERRNLFFTRRRRIYEPHILHDRTVMRDPIISTRSLFDHFPDLLAPAMQEIISRHQEVHGPVEKVAL